MKINQAENIIVRMPNWLGDLVMATPILTDLRNRFPNAKITVMCRGKGGDLLKHDPSLDELFSFVRPNGWLHREGARNILNPLRHGKYDLGLLLTHSFSSALWFWRGGVKNRIGFKGRLRDALLNEAVPFPPDVENMHLVTLYKHLLMPLGVPISQTAPKLYVSKTELEEGKDLLRHYKIPDRATLVGINPGAAYGTAKCWLPDRFHETALRLLDDPQCFILFFGDAAGKETVDAICADLPERVVNLAGKTTIRQLMALIALCSVFLTNDSGPMHIASALETPLIALFGSTNDIKTGPYNGGTVIHKHPPCSPCYKRVCPIDFRCMKDITVDEVVSRVTAHVSDS